MSLVKFVVYFSSADVPLDLAGHELNGLALVLQTFLLFALLLLLQRDLPIHDAQATQNNGFAFLVHQCFALVCLCTVYLVDFQVTVPPVNIETLVFWFVEQAFIEYSNGV